MKFALMALLNLAGIAVSIAQSAFAADLTNIPVSNEIRRLPGGSFALFITTPKTNYSRGEPIDIYVSIKHIGTSNFVDYSSLSTRMDYGACVMFTNGKFSLKMIQKWEVGVDFF